MIFHIWFSLNFHTFYDHFQSQINSLFFNSTQQNAFRNADSCKNTVLTLIIETDWGQKQCGDLKVILPQHAMHLLLALIDQSTLFMRIWQQDTRIECRIMRFVGSYQDQILDPFVKEPMNIDRGLTIIILSSVLITDIKITMPCFAR